MKQLTKTDLKFLLKQARDDGFKLHIKEKLVNGVWKSQVSILDSSKSPIEISRNVKDLLYLISNLTTGGYYRNKALIKLQKLSDNNILDIIEDKHLKSMAHECLVYNIKKINYLLKRK